LNKSSSFANAAAATSTIDDVSGKKALCFLLFALAWEAAAVVAWSLLAQEAVKLAIWLR
jgi:hypothetical protein